jgi:nucleoside-triphosphatase THEP1
LGVRASKTQAHKAQTRSLCAFLVMKLSGKNFNKMNILLTGLPKSGKTTLIEKIIQKLNRPAFGFYTKEILENKKRVGFSLITLSGNKVILSHQNFKSNYRVGKYGVDVQGFEGMALPEIEKGIQEKGIIVIDEIGKMELFSEISGDCLESFGFPKFSFRNDNFHFTSICG